MSDTVKNLILWMVIAIVLMSIFNNFTSNKERSEEEKRSEEEIGYLQFIKQVREGRIKKVLIKGSIIQGVFRNWYELCLSSVDASDDIQEDGRNLVVVALVDTALHIRIFDAGGEKVVDKTENELIGSDMLSPLKQRVRLLIDESSFARQIKQEIIDNAMLLAGYASEDGKRFTTRNPGHARLVDELIDNNVIIETESTESVLTQIFIAWSPLLILIGVWIYLMRKTVIILPGKTG